MSRAFEAGLDPFPQATFPDNQRVHTVIKPAQAVPARSAWVYVAWR